MSKRMKTSILLATIVATMLSSCKTTALDRTETGKGPTQTITEQDNNDLRFIIYYSDASAKERLLKLAKTQGDKVLYQYQNIKAIAVELKSASHQSAYSKTKGVLNVVKDEVMKLQ